MSIGVCLRKPSSPGDPDTQIDKDIKEVAKIKSFTMHKDNSKGVVSSLVLLGVHLAFETRGLGTERQVAGSTLLRSS